MKFFNTTIHLKNVVTIIKLLVGFLLLYISIQGIHWENLVTGMRNASLFWLVLAIISVLAGLFLKLWRWLIFVEKYGIRTNISRLFSAYFLSQAANILLPFRGGELIRIGYFHNDPESLPSVATTIVLEKYLDLVLLTICGILISLKISIDNILDLRCFLLPITIALSVMLILAIFFGPAIWLKIRSIKWLPSRFVELADGWVNTSQWLRDPKKILPGVLITVIIWGVMWSTNLLLFKSLGFKLGGTAAGLVLILVFIGLLPALMPGNIGPFYFFAQLALIPFGIIHEQALVFAVVLHTIVTLPPILGGAIGLLLRPGDLVAS